MTNHKTIVFFTKTVNDTFTIQENRDFVIKNIIVTGQKAITRKRFFIEITDEYNHVFYKYESNWFNNSLNLTILNDFHFNHKNIITLKTQQYYGVKDAGLDKLKVVVEIEYSTPIERLIYDQDSNALRVIFTN